MEKPTSEKTLFEKLKYQRLVNAKLKKSWDELSHDFDIIEEGSYDLQTENKRLEKELSNAEYWYDYHKSLIENKEIEFSKLKKEYNKLNDEVCKLRRSDIAFDELYKDYNILRKSKNKISYALFVILLSVFTFLIFKII